MNKFHTQHTYGQRQKKARKRAEKKERKIRRENEILKRLYFSKGPFV